MGSVKMPNMLTAKEMDVVIDELKGIHADTEKMAADLVTLLFPQPQLYEEMHKPIQLLLSRQTGLMNYLEGGRSYAYPEEKKEKPKVTPKEIEATERFIRGED